ncbi:unnamed protein product [Cercopithifilaria johnstoni]|uniref:Uncharacterized protein n=1 Tax=Cercopithifilaria johnstoni TaxID=2874296 RepID=A0A8J2MMP0_9BILA|nr:unnamed protein product [Cercopithifilaria johnstoni]
MILQLGKTTKLIGNKDYHQLRRVRDVRGSEMKKREKGRSDIQQIVEEKATNFVKWAEHLPPYIIISAGKLVLWHYYSYIRYCLWWWWWWRYSGSGSGNVVAVTVILPLNSQYFILPASTPIGPFQVGSNTTKFTDSNHRVPAISIEWLLPIAANTA